MIAALVYYRGSEAILAGADYCVASMPTESSFLQIIEELF